MCVIVLSFCKMRLYEFIELKNLFLFKSEVLQFQYNEAWYMWALKSHTNIALFILALPRIVSHCSLVRTRPGERWKIIIIISGFTLLSWMPQSLTELCGLLILSITLYAKFLRMRTMMPSTLECCLSCLYVTKSGRWTLSLLVSQDSTHMQMTYGGC